MRTLVAAIVYREDGKFLILRRKLNWKGWEFPKGSVERESLKEAVLREAKEETGAKTSIIYRLPDEIHYHHTSIKGHKLSRQIGFILEYVSGGIKVSKEHSSYKWATRGEAEKLLTHETHRIFLRHSAAYMRKHKIHSRRELIHKLSKKHVTHVKYNGKTIRLKYDGKMHSNKVVKRRVRDIGNWSKTRSIVYYDRNLSDPAILPILVHETVEKHVSQKYGLDEDTEAHKVAQAVEKEWLADKRWIIHAKIVTRAWVKTNRRKVGKTKFY